jgi:hypothetical protein
VVGQARQADLRPLPARSAAKALPADSDHWIDRIVMCDRPPYSFRFRCWRRSRSVAWRTQASGIHCPRAPSVTNAFPQAPRRRAPQALTRVR